MRFLQVIILLRLVNFLWITTLKTFLIGTEDADTDDTDIKSATTKDTSIHSTYIKNIFLKNICIQAYICFSGACIKAANIKARDATSNFIRCVNIGSTCIKIISIQVVGIERINAKITKRADVKNF